MVYNSIRAKFCSFNDGTRFRIMKYHVIISAIISYGAKIRACFWCR